MTHSRNQKIQTKTIFKWLFLIALLYWACGTDTNMQPEPQPRVSLPEEYMTISHDSTHPTTLNAWIDSRGTIQEEFK